MYYSNHSIPNLHRKLIRIVVIAALSFTTFAKTAAAAPESERTNKRTLKSDSVPIFELGEEYKEYKKTRSGKGKVSQTTEHGLLYRTALFLPNRIVDLFDVFRFDFGVGPATGAVIRVTKYAQAGVRVMTPASLRLGVRGRKAPIFIETSNELGVSPFFKQSKDREVASGEVGVGLDLILVGGYVGLDFGALGDFFAGFIGNDPAHDEF